MFGYYLNQFLTKVVFFFKLIHLTVENDQSTSVYFIFKILIKFMRTIILKCSKCVA